MKVLVCEDDRNICNGLLEILREEGYQAISACDGEQALHLFLKERPHFVCLDIMMPGMSGYDVCRRIKEIDDEVPIMFISAKSQEIDRVVALELGGDDYLVKPFGVREVISRIRAITRRCYRERFPELHEFSFAGFTVKPEELRAVFKDDSVELSLRDVKLLSILERNSGRIVPREIIFSECWDANYQPTSRTLDQHISKLRKKIKQPANSSWPIETVHGVGYRYTETCAKPLLYMRE